MIVSVRSEIDMAGTGEAAAAEQAIALRFLGKVLEIPNVPPPGITVASRGNIDPLVSTTPYSNEMGDMYGKANYDGKDTMHHESGDSALAFVCTSDATVRKND